jgi:hypothetical protein
MDYKLVVIAGDAKQKIIKIKPPTIIGRSRDADVPVGHALVSRRHCEITVSEDGTLIVEDLGSLNGTYHGDQRITEPVYLEPGDKLTVGSITFQAQYGDFQSETDPPPTKANAKSKAAADEDDLPDFLSNDDEDEEAEEEDAPNFEATVQKPKAPVADAKKRRPPPPVIESNTDDEDIADMLELPEEEDEEVVEEVEEIEEDGNSDVDAKAEADDKGDSRVPVGEDDLEASSGSDSADIEEEVEVAAGDSRSGDSGSGMSWLTGDEDDEEGSGKKGGESGLDDFFKSL